MKENKEDILQWAKFNLKQSNKYLKEVRERKDISDDDKEHIIKQIISSVEICNSILSKQKS